MDIPPVHVESWVREILVDPLGKTPLMINEAENLIRSEWGMNYPIIHGIFDLRLLKNETTKDQHVWKEGQVAFEKWAKNLADRDKSMDYFREIEGVRGVYEDIPIVGSCLDVGGHQGRLRQFLKPGQKYVSCDPFYTVFDQLKAQPNLLKAYPFLMENVNFICCDAEMLPFKARSFQTVHMRSVIDHFLNPEMALLESYRVLEENGVLIIGLTVIGGKTGKLDLKTQIKEGLRDCLTKIGFDKYKDHHIWHPTFSSLKELIEKSGFRIEKVHWQKGLEDKVCYIKSVKCEGYMR